eukprot:SM000255S08773  [mRNA]  locus=s255:54565:55718:+ [translate_table: standard]
MTWEDRGREVQADGKAGAERERRAKGEEGERREREREELRGEGREGEEGGGGRGLAFTDVRTRLADSSRVRTSTSTCGGGGSGRPRGGCWWRREMTAAATAPRLTVTAAVTIEVPWAARSPPRQSPPSPCRYCLPLPPADPSTDKPPPVARRFHASGRRSPRLAVPNGTRFQEPSFTDLRLLSRGY